MLFLSPLLGSAVATILMLTYSVIEVGSVSSVLLVFPIVFGVFAIVSYVFSLTLGKWLIYRQDMNFFSDGVFMFYAFLIGFAVGLAFSVLSFYINSGSILKSVFIVLSFSLGGLFNASFYVSLRKELKIKK
jgi:hypothetical protein